MQLKNLFAIGLGPAMVAGRVLVGRGVDCVFYETPGSGVTCEALARAYGLTIDGFEMLNPGVTCPNLELNKQYCVMGTYTPDPSSATTTSRTASSSSSTSSTSITTQSSATSPSSSSTRWSSTTTVPPTSTRSSTITTSTPTPSNTATPSPVQEGMVGNCNRFHFVQQGQTCATIAAMYSISVAQFIQWNPAAQSDCTGLWASTYACVGIAAASPTPTTTKPGNGITTPTPAHPGMVSNCNKFVYVNPGDTCDGISFWNNVGGGQWVKLWNGIEEECRSIQAHTYVCIGVIGGTPTPTTTRTGNGIATPTPAHPGMVGNCNRFVYVNPGDTCDGIAFWNGVEGGGRMVKLWNNIEEECRSIQAYTYVCIGVV